MPALWVAGGAAVAGLATSALSATSKKTDTFDRTKQSQYFSSPEQTALAAELKTQGEGINKGVEGMSGTYAALASEGEKFATGKYLDPNEAGNQGFLEATRRPMERSFAEKTVPDLLSYIARGRSFGGERASDLFRQTYRDYTESVGDVTHRALGDLANMRVQGYNAAGSVATQMTDAAGRLNAIRASILPSLQMVREYGSGSGTATPSMQDQSQNALLQALVMYGGTKVVSKM